MFVNVLRLLLVWPVLCPDGGLSQVWRPHLSIGKGEAGPGCPCEPLPLTTLRSKAVTQCREHPAMHKTAANQSSVCHSLQAFHSHAERSGEVGQNRNISCECISFTSSPPPPSSPKKEQCSSSAGKPGRWGADRPGSLVCSQVAAGPQKAKTF